jgi:hypothetical protein
VCYNAAHVVHWQSELSEDGENGIRAVPGNDNVGAWERRDGPRIVFSKIALLALVSLS